MAREFIQQRIQTDLILTSDMLDVSILRSQLYHTKINVPIALYFHENQLTYPQNQRQGHGWRYGFINYVSALAADMIFFNSEFHLDIFYDTLPKMLKHFGDYNELQTIDELRAKSSVLPLGVDLRRFDRFQTNHKRSIPLIVWNHRWEEEKNPTTFLNALLQLQADGIPFEVALLGENVRQEPEEFEQARQQLGSRVIQYGYVDSFAKYAELLWQADYVVSSAYQDFFGISVVEGIYCGCVPILPKRLNYPYLVPTTVHDVCLYSGEKLYALLRHHLVQSPQIDTERLRTEVTRYDWGEQIEVYDRVLADVAH